MRPNHPSAKILATVLAATAMLLTTACVPRAQPPAAAPVPVQPPAPPPPSTRLHQDWHDAPATPGNWHWSMEGGQSVARFAEGALVLSCSRAEGTITLLRAGFGQGQVPMTIMTDDGAHPLSGTPQAGPPPAIAVAFSARDPLLDAMGFSRGRFAVEVAGLPTIYVPSWPEVSRVIEDCRQ